MKVLIGNGKVSSIIKDVNDVVLDHCVIEITNKNSIYQRLSKFSPGTIVVNTAAKINLEWCESNKEESFATNASGAVNIGNVCKDLGLKLVHISSGCIFDGMETEKIYSEDDTPTPACWYAKTKYIADLMLTDIKLDNLIIVRPRQLVSARPYSTNMLTKFMSLDEGKFIASKNSLTCIEDMKLMIDHLISKNYCGIFNLANENYFSPYEIALMIKSKTKPSLKVQEVSYDEYVKNLGVKRVNTLLNINKLKQTGFSPRTAKDAVSWCLDNYGKK